MVSNLSNGVPDGMRPTSGRSSLRDFLWFTRYLAHRPYSFLGGIACLLVNSGLSLLFPLLLGSMVNVALKTGQTLVPMLGSLNLQQIVPCLAGVIVMQALSTAGATYLFGRVSQMVLHELRADIYVKLVSFPMAFYAQRRVGELTSRLSSDTAQLEGGLVVALPQLCRQILMLGGAVTMVAHISGQLLIAALSVLPAFIGVTLFFGRKLRRIARQTQDRRAETAIIVEETLQSITSVKAFVNEALEIERYQTSDQAARSSAITASGWRAAFGASIALTLYGGIAFVIWLGARRLMAGQITAGELTGFLVYSIYMAGAMSQLAQLYSQLQVAAGASQRLHELRGEPVEEDSPGPAASSTPTSRLRGTVEFREVSFRYTSRPETPVLRDVSFRAEAGEVIALVGPSGAGKSTLVSLILRFFKPDQGMILIDGRPAQDYPLAELRRQMALVPQDILLFGGSIIQNIGYGRPGATEEEIQAAARQAAAEEFITRMPDGYTTVVGDRGSRLSGGQRQRIAIARAILRNPAILILDEATSSLDGETEARVQGAFESLMCGRTTFIIAHRLATLRRADRVMVLEEGRVVASGPHEELMARPDGFYRRLCVLQGLVDE